MRGCAADFGRGCAECFHEARKQVLRHIQRQAVGEEENDQAAAGDVPAVEPRRLFQSSKQFAIGIHELYGVEAQRLESGFDHRAVTDHHEDQVFGLQVVPGSLD